MTEDIETGTASGIERRDFIKKSAIVGGLVWAAPAMSALGPRAFGQENNGTPRCTAISNIAIVFTANGTTYQAKFDLDDGCAGSGNATPNCDDPDGWGTGADGCKFITWDTSDECCWRATINLPEPLKIVSVVGVIEGGGGDDRPAGFCVGESELVQTNGANTYQWCAPTR